MVYESGFMKTVSFLQYARKQDKSSDQFIYHNQNESTLILISNRQAG